MQVQKQAECPAPSLLLAAGGVPTKGNRLVAICCGSFPGSHVWKLSHHPRPGHVLHTLSTLHAVTSLLFQESEEESAPFFLPCVPLQELLSLPKGCSRGLCKESLGKSWGRSTPSLGGLRRKPLALCWHAHHTLWPVGRLLWLWPPTLSHKLVWHCFSNQA